MTREFQINGKKVVQGSGSACGRALVARETICFWGEYDPIKGRVNKPDSPIFGANFRNRILVIESTKGSSGNIMAFKLSRLEGNAPAGMIVTNVDALGVFGAIVADVPTVVVTEQDPFDLIDTGDWVEMDAAKGCITVKKDFQEGAS